MKKRNDFFSMLHRAIKLGNLSNKVFCWLLIKLGYSNESLQALEIRNKIFNYIKGKYEKDIGSLSYCKNENSIMTDDVWICWLQGIENAPDIVKACYRSVLKWLPHKKVHVIDICNYKKYVQLPEYIIKKWEEGIISNAHFADLLRLELLIEYGGMWLDATVYLTGNIPDYLGNQRLFMYQTPTYDVTRLCDNWFIISEKNNRILQGVRDILYEFWKKENKVKEYFIFHLVMKLVMEKYSEDWDEMIKIPCEIPLMLSKSIFEKYDEIYMDTIKEITTIHKLSNKYCIPDSTEGTYYEFICGK